MKHSKTLGADSKRHLESKRRSRGMGFGPCGIFTGRIRQHGLKPILLLLVLLPGAAAASGDTVVSWDFTQGLHGWTGNRQVADLAVSAEGLAFRSTGGDPWIEGPPVDFPGEGVTRVTVRMKSSASAGGELFYGETFAAGRSVRFSVQADGRWHDYSLLIREPLGKRTRFRLDPAVGAGAIVVASIRAEVLPVIPPPQFAQPHRPGTEAVEPLSLPSGGLVLRHYHGRWGQFTIEADGVEMATGYDAELIGWLKEAKPQWLPLDRADFACTRDDGGLISRATLKDDDGATWRVTRRFEAGAEAGTIRVETTVVADKDRNVIYLPWLTLFPGLGTFGAKKTQGLFAGLEYLADEPSSSEADIATPEHVRRVPDPLKITFPLMAVAHDGRYVGLMWEPSEAAAPVFDSPDTIYGSQAHVMALTAPAVGARRFENDLVAHTPFALAAGRPLTARALILGGRGETIIPAVKKYVALKGLPDVPTFRGGLDGAVKLLAHGWLDSAANEGGLFRHAVWGESFKAGPAGDAPMYIDWLANYADADLRHRLDDGRDLAVTKMPRGRPWLSTVSHTRTPTAPFVFGGIYPYVEQRLAQAKNMLRNFDAQGVKRYRPGKVDYGRTHFAPHANGHAGVDVVRIMEAATLSGDAELIERALELLDKQTALYANTVPRGAQVWEMPLHTPDILASAHMVKAYTLGYLISSRPRYLEQARYWAWTGVPFLYLVNPTDGEVGPYATIAVLGATNWKAPCWFGRPVQWCGLVYASALHLLAQYDREGPWLQIAKGITAAGLQMTWPADDEKRQGLLPDFFHLRPQISDGPAINPGTVQAHVPELFDKGTLYDVKRLAGTGWFVHAPCRILDVREEAGRVTFAVEGWDRKTCYVLLSGVARRPARVAIREHRPGPVAPQPFQPVKASFQPNQRLMAITAVGPTEIRIEY